MKKYLSILAISAMASSAFAQGTVAFANNNNSLIKLGTTWSDPAPVTLTSGYAQLFAAPSGTVFVPYSGQTAAAFLAANPGWAFYGNPTAVGTTVAGRFNGGTVTNTAIAPGAAMEAAIIAWNGNFQSFDAAITGQASIGSSATAIHLANTGNPVAVPATTATPLNTGTGLGAVIVAPSVPEPTSLALIGLGAAAMLVMRRRK